MALTVRRRPEEAIRDVRRSSKTAEAEEKQRRDGISKTATIMGDKSLLGESAGVTHPTDDQLEVINGFTRSEKTAEDLIVFDTLSCNDLVDRDDDFFKTECVKAFTKLPEPYSPVGKSFMVSHDYSKLPVGRIFGVGTQKIEVPDSKTIQSLTNSVFMPNTAQYQDFIENMDYGIYWAVSVGVVLNGATCQVGKEHAWGPFSWWCSQGHEKGFYYDPDSDEEDSWGWPMPVEEDAKGAVPCVRAFEDPRDFFELSMCFLGAQYFAELVKDPSFSGVVKTSSATSAAAVFEGNERHLFALGSKAAEKLPMPHAPERVVEGLTAKTRADFDGDGNLMWVEGGMVWQYDLDSDDPDVVMCLGEAKEGDEPVVKDVVEDVPDGGETKAPHGNFDGTHTHAHSAYGDQGNDDEHEHAHTHNNDAVHDHTHEVDANSIQGWYDRVRSILDSVEDRIASYKDTEGAGDDEDEDPADMAQALDATLDAVRDAMDEENYDQASDLLTSAESTVDALVELLGGTDPDDTDTGKTAQGEEMSKKAVIAAVKAAGLPAEFYEKLAEAEDNGLADVLTLVAERLKTADSELQTLKPKAELGEQYAKSLRDDVRKSFVRAYQKPNEKINTKTVDRLIKLAGDDIDLLKELKDQYEDVVRQRFKRPETIESAVIDDPDSDDVDHNEQVSTPSSSTIHSKVRVPGERNAK